MKKYRNAMFNYLELPPHSGLAKILDRLNLDNIWDWVMLSISRCNSPVIESGDRRSRLVLHEFGWVLHIPDQWLYMECDRRGVRIYRTQGFSMDGLELIECANLYLPGRFEYTKCNLVLPYGEGKQRWILLFDDKVEA